MTPEVREYRDAVAELGCLICLQPAEIHHAKGGSMLDAHTYKGMGQKTGEEAILPLCPRHHRGEQGIEKIGVETWERKFGRQSEMLNIVTERLEARAARVIGKKIPTKAPSAKGRAPAKASSKILPRFRCA